MILDISICPLQGGGFEVMFKDKETGEEIIFTGKQEINKRGYEFVNRIAPSCVWTRYQRLTPED